MPTKGPRLPAVSEREFAGEAVRFAVEHLSEREAAFSRRDALVESLRAARGAATSQAISAELDRWIGAGHLVSDATDQWLTTLQRLRRNTIVDDGAAGTQRHAGDLDDVDSRREGLSFFKSERRPAFTRLLFFNAIGSRCEWIAGTGKTTALRVARDLAERKGFEFVGLAPSHSAVRALEKSGINRRPCSAGFWIGMQNRS